VLSPDSNIFMNVQQAINLQLVRIFGENHIDFAFPAQTLHLHDNTTRTTAPTGVSKPTRPLVPPAIG